MICNKTMKIFTILSLCLYFSSTIMWAEGSESATPAPSLPYESSSFQQMRTKGMIYVDKTMFIERILDLDEPPYILLTRPSLFGKSTFVEMLYHFFSAHRHLFNDTYIAKRFPQEWTKYPVINMHFCFATSIISIAGIDKYEKELEINLWNIGKTYGLDYASSYRIDFLIKNLKAKYGQPVVILIDAYDSLFKRVYRKHVDLIDKFKATACKFYHMLKQQRNNIKLVFMTGISRLFLSDFECGVSQQSNIYDATFSKNFSSATGFTLEEIESNFKPYLQRLADHYGVSVLEITENLIESYSGYRFSLKDDKTKVFNPISVIACFRNMKIGNFWEESTYTEDILQMMKNKSKNTAEELYYYSVGVQEVRGMYNDEFGPEVPSSSLLYNHGYLTIKRYNEKSKTVILAYPNIQIENSILEKLMGKSYEPMCDHGMNISIREHDIESFIDFLNKSAFRKYKLLQIDKIDESVATKHILDTLVSNKLGAIYSTKIIDGQDGQTVGDIDIHLQNEESSEYLPADMALIIEVKCGHSAVAGMIQLFTYAVKNPKSFRQKINNVLKKDGPTYSYLLAINIGSREGLHPEIQEWIAVPYRDGKIFADEMVAKLDKDKDVSEELGTSWKDEIRSWNNKGLTMDTEILVWSYLTSHRKIFFNGKKNKTLIPT
ncbi:uncharacterized protein LOC135846088 [Planococcus citri]|uniref:uncharacterized protein LOC135846088 n=1 Tax=Planococcus citri TaxID=170843 RepID=UPI0031F82693